MACYRRGFFVFWALGQLPTIFAWPAGIGDIFVRIAAPGAAIALQRRAAYWRWRVYLVTFAGIADFTLAFTAGIFAREGAVLHFDGALASSLLGVTPLSLFPTFIVPALLLLHIIALLKLRDLAG